MQYKYQEIKDLKIPNEWEDVTYGNDACCSFSYRYFQIFIDHKNIKEREIQDGFRYTVILEKNYGYGFVLLQSNNFNEVKKFVKQSVKNLIKNCDKQNKIQFIMHERSNQNVAHKYFLDYSNLEKRKSIENEYKNYSEEKLNKTFEYFLSLNLPY